MTLPPLVVIYKQNAEAHFRDSHASRVLDRAILLEWNIILRTLFPKGQGTVSKQLLKVSSGGEPSCTCYNKTLGLRVSCSLYTNLILGDLQSVIDSSNLNYLLVVTKFHLGLQASLCLCIQEKSVLHRHEGSAYACTHSRAICILQFQAYANVYLLACLSFGLSMSLKDFTTIPHRIVQILHLYRVKFRVHLDVWLIRASIPGKHLHGWLYRYFSIQGESYILTNRNLLKFNSSNSLTWISAPMLLPWLP